jgi:hypothetical protein
MPPGIRKRRVFRKIELLKRQPANLTVSQWVMLFRILATLSFAVGFDVLLCDGRYTRAVERLALTVALHF